MSRLLRAPWLRSALITLAAVAILHWISSVTGLGAWYDANPAAKEIARGIMVLFLGAIGLFGLIWAPRDDPDWKPWRFRLAALFPLTIALANAAILLSGRLGFAPE